MMIWEVAVWVVPALVLLWLAIPRWTATKFEKDSPLGPFHVNVRDAHPLHLERSARYSSIDGKAWLRSTNGDPAGLLVTFACQQMHEHAQRKEAWAELAKHAREESGDVPFVQRYGGAVLVTVSTDTYSATDFGSWYEGPSAPWGRYVTDPELRSRLDAARSEFMKGAGL